MANNLITSTIVSKETLLNHENELVIANVCDWSYSDKFGNPSDQIGQTYTFRRPINVTVTSDNMAWQAANATVFEPSVQIVVDRTESVPMNFSEADLMLKVEKFSERYIKPTVRTMASKIDSRICDSIINSKLAGDGTATSGLVNGTVANSAGYVVTKAGATLAPSDILAAKKVLLDKGCPDDGEIYGVLSTTAQTALVAAQATLFNPLMDVDAKYRKGRIGDYAGIHFAVSQSLPAHVNGAQTSLVISAASSITNQANTLWAETSTITVTATGAAVKAGDMFQVAGVYVLNPLNKSVTDTLFQFQVLADANSGATSLTIAPAPITAGPYANVSATIVGATTTLVGSANAVLNESLIFHSKAIQIVSPSFVEPPKSGNGNSVSSMIIRDPEDLEGFKFRFLRAYDAFGVASVGGVGTGGPGFASRLDAAYGVKVSNRDWIVRIRA